MDEPLFNYRASSHMAGAESPSMADLSSNNGEDSPQRAKKGGGKRKSRHSRNLLTPTGIKNNNCRGTFLSKVTQPP